VVISLPDACAAIMVHDLTARPSKWTTHAPHCPVSHPTWVPVRPSVSRRNSTSRVRSSTCRATARPLTLTLISPIWRLPFFFRYRNTLENRDLARKEQTMAADQVSMQCLLRRNYDAATLVCDHPPRLRHPHKRLVFELCGGAATRGAIAVTRWAAATLPAAAVLAPTETVAMSGTYDYAAHDRG